MTASIPQENEHDGVPRQDPDRAWTKDLQEADSHEVRPAEGPDDRGLRQGQRAVEWEEASPLAVLYRFADLVLRSEVPLSELPVAFSGPPECLFRIRRSERPEPFHDRWDHHWRSPEGDVVLSCARDGDAYRLGVPGLSTFLIEDGGRAITCRPDFTLPPGTLEHLLIDQVLPRVLTHRGRLVIHAGCVVTPQGAIGFLGDSGTGKSTVCADFARAGHPLLGDDGIVVRRTATEAFEAIATYPGLRLLPDPLTILFDERAGAAPVAHYTAKRRIDRNHTNLTLAANPQPLRALYVLDTADEITIAPLPERDAFIALVGASFQLHLDDQERSRGLFERIGTLLDAVPVRRLSYPRDFTRLGAVREALLADAAAVATPASSAGCACS